MLPTVSIVIPTYNRASFLEKCLLPLLQQSYPLERYEVIMIDDGSTDDTVSRAQTLVRGWPGVFRLLQQANAGPASARNTGLAASTADIIAFVDSDCAVQHDWLNELVTAIGASNADGIGGPIIGGDIDNWVARYLEAVKFYRHRVQHGQVDYLVTTNTAFKRAALLAIGGFAADSPDVWAEDVDLSFKLKAAGYTLAVTNAAPMIHYGTLNTVRALINKLYIYGRGNAMRSASWGADRTPAIELLRHLGAVCVAPWIALRRTHGAGIIDKFSFWPLIMIEHTAFAFGLISGLIKRPRTAHNVHTFNAR